MQRRTFVAIAVAALLTVAYCVLLAVDAYPLLRGPDEWRWAYGRPGTYQRLWVPIAMLGVHVLLSSGWLARPDRKWAPLVWVIFFTPLLQLGLLYMDHPDPLAQLFYRVISNQTNGYLRVGAGSAETHTFLQNFVANMPSYPIHVQRHPPGLPLLFLWTRQLLEKSPQLNAGIGNALRGYQCHNLDIMYLPNSVLASAILQVLQPLYAGVIAWPLYKFAQRFYSKRVALNSILMWPVLPGVALWATSWNVLYGAFTLVVLFLIYHGLEKRALWCFPVAGVLISVALFFTFGNVMILAFAGLLGLVWLAVNWKRRHKWDWLFLACVGGAVGVVSIWFIAWLATGLEPGAVFDTAMSTHLDLGYDYWTWIFFHPWDFFVFLGIPLFVFCLLALGRALSNSEYRLSAAWILTLSFFLLLFLMVFSGTSQGEVARVWAFLYPIALVVAAGSLPSDRRVVIALIVLLGVQTVVGNVYLRLHDTALVHSPTAPGAVATSGEALVSWESGASLISVEATLVDDGLLVRSVWSAFRPIYQPYTQFLHLLDANGTLVAQQDGMALGGGWPTTCWQTDVAFVDQKIIPLDENLPNGNYQLVTGWYYLPTGRRDLLLDGVRDAVIVVPDLEIVR